MLGDNLVGQRGMMPHTLDPDLLRRHPAFALHLETSPKLQGSLSHRPG
jgi:hypothetical protein